jgi:hypothetical protein
MIQWLNVKGVPIQVQDCIFTNQRREQRKKGCYGYGEKGHFVEVCPNKPTPKTKKKARKAKHQPSPQSRLGMIHQVKIKPNTRGAITSTSHVCLTARGNESSSPCDSDSEDELPSCEQLVQQNLNYAKSCTSQQKKLKVLKEKLDSSQQAYKALLEQYETFANLNVELSTKIEQLEASANK